MKKEDTGKCCSRFDPMPWDEKEIVWDKKLFVKDRVVSLFHIPVNFGAVMTRNVTKLESANAKTETMVVLTDEGSLWGSDVFIEATKEVAGVKMSKISGCFLSKVFEGSYSNMGKWIEQMKEFVRSRNKALKKIYFYYTTCPKCAKKYGKNYVVILAQV